MGHFWCVWVPLGHRFGRNSGSVWGPVGPFWHHFGVLEAPVEALWDLVGPHCLHGRVWERSDANFGANLDPQMDPKSMKK